MRSLLLLKHFLYLSDSLVGVSRVLLDIDVTLSESAVSKEDVACPENEPRVPCKTADLASFVKYNFLLGVEDEVPDLLDCRFLAGVDVVSKRVTVAKGKERRKRHCSQERSVEL